MKKIRIKEWLFDKVQNEARRHNIFIDTPERTNDEFRKAVVHDDGTVLVIAEETLSETDKAIKVRLSSGSVVGSHKGWILWAPKSQIVFEN